MTKPNQGQGDPGPLTSRAKPADEGFLGRWSRRKAEATRPATVADAEPVAAETDLAATNEQPSKETQPSPADTDQVGQLPAAAAEELPDIDRMGPGSDFSVFMQAGVPPALRTKALRKLWRMKPELANLDGLLDYGEDLTGSFKVTDHLKTAYEVGKGFLRDVEDNPEKEIMEDEAGALEDTPIAEEAEPAKIDRASKDPDPERSVVEGGTSSEKISKG